MSLSQSKWVKKTTKPKAKPKPKETNSWKETSISEGMLADLLTPFIAPNHRITKMIFGDVVDGQVSLTYSTEYKLGE